MAITTRELQDRLGHYFPGQQGVELVKCFSAITADIAKVKSWGDTLAAKLNADAGVTDTNYALTGL